MQSDEWSITSPDEFADFVGDGGTRLHFTPDAKVDVRVQEKQLSQDLTILRQEGTVSGLTRVHVSRPVEVMLDRVNVNVNAVTRGTSTTLDGVVGQRELVPGGGFLYDMRSEHVVENPGFDRSLELHVQRSALTSLIGGEPPSFVTVPATSRMVRMLRVVAEEVMAPGPEISGFESQQVSDTLLEMVGALCRSITDGREVAPTGRQALLRVITADIDARLNDPDLSPSQLAARHHVSLRYVHSLFDEIDSTPGGYIREQRLRRAARALTHPGLVGEGITQVAHDLGFGSPSTFTRAFRRRFEMSPSEWREAVANGSAKLPVAR